MRDRYLIAHPTWRQLTAPVIKQSSSLPQSIVPVSRKPIETPAPSTFTTYRQQKKRRSRLLFLILALLLIMLAAGVGLLSYATGRPNARSFAPTAHTNSTVTTIATFPTVTTHPTQVATSTPRPKVKPTSPSQPVIGPTMPVVPTAVPTMRPMPPPTKTPAPHPSPTPTLSPTPVPYPNIAGNYTGTIFDQTANITTGMSLYIQQKSGQGNIGGYFTVNPPLVGSGNFTGTVNTGKYMQFTVQSYHGNAPLYLWGWVQQDSSLKGDYCSLNSKSQCDPSVGASGTWNVGGSGS